MGFPSWEDHSNPKLIGFKRQSFKDRAESFTACKNGAPEPRVLQGRAWEAVKKDLVGLPVSGAPLLLGVKRCDNFMAWRENRTYQNAKSWRWQEKENRDFRENKGFS